MPWILIRRTRFLAVTLSCFGSTICEMDFVSLSVDGINQRSLWHINLLLPTYINGQQAAFILVDWVAMEKALLLRITNPHYWDGHLVWKNIFFSYFYIWHEHIQRTVCTKFAAQIRFPCLTFYTNPLLASSKFWLKLEQSKLQSYSIVVCMQNRIKYFLTIVRKT